MLRLLLLCAAAAAALQVDDGQRDKRVRLPRPEVPRRGCSDLENECMSRDEACHEPTCRTGVIERPRYGECKCAFGRVRNLMSGECVDLSRNPSGCDSDRRRPGDRDGVRRQFSGFGNNGYGGGSSSSGYYTNSINNGFNNNNNFPNQYSSGFSGQQQFNSPYSSGFGGYSSGQQYGSSYTRPLQNNFVQGYSGGGYGNSFGGSGGFGSSGSFGNTGGFGNAGSYGRFGCQGINCGVQQQQSFGPCNQGVNCGVQSVQTYQQPCQVNCGVQAVQPVQQPCQTNCGVQSYVRPRPRPFIQPNYQTRTVIQPQPTYGPCNQGVVNCGQQINQQVQTYQPTIQTYQQPQIYQPPCNVGVVGCNQQNFQQQNFQPIQQQQFIPQPVFQQQPQFQQQGGFFGGGGGCGNNCGVQAPPISCGIAACQPGYSPCASNRIRGCRRKTAKKAHKKSEIKEALKKTVVKKN